MHPLSIDVKYFYFCRIGYSSQLTSMPLLMDLQHIFDKTHLIYGNKNQKSNIFKKNSGRFSFNI
jgi:hypothetical protein